MSDGHLPNAWGVHITEISIHIDILIGESDTHWNYYNSLKKLILCKAADVDDLI